MSYIPTSWYVTRAKKLCPVKDQKDRCLERRKALHHQLGRGMSLGQKQAPFERDQELPGKDVGVDLALCDFRRLPKLVRQGIV